MIVSLMMLSLLYYHTYNAEESITQNNIVAEADFLAADLNRGLTNYGTALRTLGEFYPMISPAHEPTAFHDLTKDLIELYPGISGLSWSPLVSSSDREHFEQTMQSSGLSNFRITEIGYQDRLQLASQRNFYVPLTYTEPADLWKKWIGFDINSIGQNQSAIRKAIEKSHITASLPFNLAQDPTSPASIMFLYPVKRETRNSQGRLNENIQGFVVAIIRIPDLIGSIAGTRLKIQNLDLHIDSYDGANFYDSFKPNTKKFLGYAQTRYLSGIEGVHWKLTVIPTEAFFEKFGERNSTVVFIGGICFIGLLGTFLVVLLGRNERLARETTEKIRTQAALVTSEARKAAALEASLDAIIAIDCQGRIIDFNPSAEKMFLYKKEDVIGQDLSTKIIPERLRKSHNEGVARYLRTRIPKILGARVEVFAIRSDGSEFPIEISPVSLQIGGETFFTGVVRDITDRKTLEEMLKSAKESAEAASEAKSAFLANMSHEIRTPLGAILGFSEIIASKSATEEERSKYLEIIKRNGALLSSVINDILDISKVEAGKFEIEVTQCSIAEILRDIETLLKSQALEKGIGFTVDIHPDAPTVIYTDPLRLTQILLNVAGNAVKFTDCGVVKIAVYLADPRIAHGCVQFDVIDTGPGISELQAEKLFKTFSQADPSTKRRFGGTGLGLVLAKKLANLLGGDLTLKKSSIGIGSVFSIQISTDMRTPQQVLSEMSQSIPQQPVNVANKTIDSIKKACPLRGKRILLTEDVPDLRIMIGSLLNYSGASVEIAENGKEAVELLHKKKFDAVLMDLQMPVMDGYEATRLLRKEGYSLPIIALTAHALGDHETKCIEVGFNAHVSKPIQVEKLVQTISSLTNS